jgi:hypothetical protein
MHLWKENNYLIIESLGNLFIKINTKISLHLTGTNIWSWFKNMLLTYAFHRFASERMNRCLNFVLFLQVLYTC